MCIIVGNMGKNIARLEHRACSLQRTRDRGHVHQRNTQDKLTTQGVVVDKTTCEFMEDI